MIVFEESTGRSVVKAVSWRVLATLTTAALVFAFTRQLDIAVAVGLLETATKIFLYVGHERVWNKLTFGRRPLASTPTAQGASGGSRTDRPVGERDAMTV